VRKPLTAKKGAIHYDRIGFHYGKGKGVIDNLSLDIKAGEKVGLSVAPAPARRR
jgi:ATP-binding cassette subfamily B multidrug efflux pump